MDSLSDYDYELPEELIAQTPLDDRAASRLLVLNRADGVVTHRMFRDLPELLEPGDMLVLNETRVTALRLSGVRHDTGGKVELLVLRPAADGGHDCLAKPARRLATGVRLEFDEGLEGVVLGTGEHGARRVRFNDAGLLRTVGRAPLPPYIHAPVDEPDRYQTVYARADADAGSAAAPTAGLHFTPELLAEIRQRGVRIATVTLEVGIDTFRPVQAEHIDDHVMHGETCALPAETASAIAEATGRVIAVGTTTARTLETFARMPGAEGRRLTPGTTTSTLFLRPGNPFRVVDCLLTNFHLPRTTMLMMLSAFAGRDQILHAYREAITGRYRFLSFGDAMFVV